MNTDDKAQTGHYGCSTPEPSEPSEPPGPAKRAYQTPRVIELGDVRELTRGNSGSAPDGRQVSRKAGT
jgi:hypothetical protein